MDSMVNHYSVSKRHKRKRSVFARWRNGFRPDRATIVYCNKIREAYKDIPVVIGGIEAYFKKICSL